MWLTTWYTSSGYHTSVVGTSEQSEVNSSVVECWVLALLFHSETLQWLPLSSQALVLPHPATPHSHANLLSPHRKPGRTFSRPHTILISWHDYGKTPWNWRPWALPPSSEFTLTRDPPTLLCGSRSSQDTSEYHGGFNDDLPASGLLNHGSNETLLNSNTLGLPKRRGKNSPIAPQIWFHCTWSMPWYDLTSWDDWAIQVKAWAIVQQIWTITWGPYTG